MSRVLRIRTALAALTVVVAVGTLGYILLGFAPLDALYQTITTITTVGFREVNPLSSGRQGLHDGLDPRPGQHSAVRPRRPAAKPSSRAICEPTWEGAG